MHIKSFVVYTEHIKTKHPKKRIKHFNLKPDFHDPDMCCKSCERTYKTKGLYHLHLKSTHQINAPGREPEIVIATQDSNENSFYCSGCNKHIEDHTSYMRHIKATHSKKHIKHFNLKPDFYDPNKYCKSCERTYKSKTLYRLHLKKTHLIDAPCKKPKTVIAKQKSNINGFYCSGCNKHIENQTSYTKHIITKHPKKRIKHFNLKPDFYDPNKYCKSCERTYKTKALYRLHLKNTHKLVPTNFEPKIIRKNSNENGVYCCGCNSYIKGHASYLKHIKLQHSSKQIRHFNMRPDINDPNMYCNACERTYGTTALYRHHLKISHKIIRECFIPKNLKQSSSKLGTYCCGCDTYIKGQAPYLIHIKTKHPKKKIKHFDLKPDINDPNHYCKSCDRTYSASHLYQGHLKLTHRLSSIGVNQKRTPNQKQNSNNPKYHCSMCQQQFVIEEVYKNHLNGFIHKSRARKLDPNTLPPDPSDPNFYCRSCHKTYSTQQRYLIHIRGVHKEIQYLKTYKKDLQKKHISYCFKCKMSFTSPELYYKHIKIHRTELDLTKSKPMQTSESHQLILTRSKANLIYKTLPNSNDGQSINCQFCEQSFKTRNQYSLHLRLDHHLALKNTEPDQSNLKNTQPSKRSRLRTEMKSKYDSYIHHNYDKSGIYCQYCDNSFKSTNSYHHHQCKTIQGKQPQGLTTQKENLPDPSDPNNYCSICKITFKNIPIFRKHCIGKHLMQLAPLPYNRHFNPVVVVRNRPRKKVRFEKPIFSTIEKDSNLLPDPFSPQFYCSVCNTKNNTLSAHHRHCREIHQMKLKPLHVYQLSNSDAKINMLNPESTVRNVNSLVVVNKNSKII